MIKETGNCFEQAFNYLTNLSISDPKALEHLVLVHGFVHGTGEMEGLTFAHAWIENTQTAEVTDFHGHEKRTASREWFYLLGKPFWIERFDWEGIKQKALGERTSGPWTQRLLGGPYWLPNYGDLDPDYRELTQDEYYSIRAEEHERLLSRYQGSEQAS